MHNDRYIVGFVLRPDLNLVMNSIRILNDNEISLSFRLIYFMTYTVYLSQQLTNLMHKILFYNKLVSCHYMFRAHVLIIRRSKLHYTASGIITPIRVMIPEAA